MRVIAGKYKGRTLSTVPDLSVRPATDRVKSAIFNILQSKVHWGSANVLDLYAGSGSIGIEALSRGAKKVVFVEQDKNALTFLKNNITHVGADNESSIIFGDVSRYLQSKPPTYNVVFADPPYAIDALASLPTAIFESGVVSSDGILIMEHPTYFKFTPHVLWEAFDERTYGRTAISFFQHNTAQEIVHEKAPE